MSGARSLDGRVAVGHTVRGRGVEATRLRERREGVAEARFLTREERGEDASENTADMKFSCDAPSSRRRIR